MRIWIAIAASLALSACFLLKQDAPPAEPSAPPQPRLRLAPGCDAQAGGSAREWSCTGDKLNDAGRVRQAQRAYRRALGAHGLDDRQRAYALGGLAVTSADLGECEEAESAVEELRELAPRNPLARVGDPVCASLRKLAGP